MRSLTAGLIVPGGGGGAGLTDGDYGDITVGGVGTTMTIDNDVVTYAKIQNVSATDRLLGRDTAAAGDIEELTASGGLEFTGTGIQTSAFTGDVTKAAGGTATTIANDAVTYAKMQNVSATDKVLGRSTAGAGDVEEIACTAAGRALLDDASAAAQQVTLGLAPAQLTMIFAGGDTGGYNPADTTAFYFGLFFSPTSDPTTTAPTGAGGITPAMVVAGTIKSIYLGIIVGGTLGTTETGTGSIRVNNTTDTVVFNNTLQWNAVSQSYSATGLSIALAAGDFFVFKVTPPAWATNPTVTFYGAQVVISFP